MSALTLEVSRWLWDYYLLATVLLTVVLVATKWLVQPARRMAIHWSAAGGLMLLALLCAIPGWSVVHMLSASPSVTIDVPPASIAPSVQTLLLPSEPPIVFQQTPMPSDNIVSPVPPTPSPTETWSIDFDALVFALPLGSVLVLLWFMLGAWQLHRLRSQAQQASPELVELLQKLTPTGQQVPELGVVAKLSVAAAVGLRRPMVLLPKSFLESTSLENLQTVLAHELAHIRHRDLWLLALLRVSLLVLWPHPLFWLWRRNVRLDQETLADAAAADVTNRTDYAEQLVAWARLATEFRAPRLASSIGLWESPSQLKRRIAILLDEKLTVLRACSRRWRVGSTFALLLLAVGLSLVTLQPESFVVAKPNSAETTNLPSPQSVTKKLNNGTSVELLAIGTNSRDKNQKWWSAQGEILQEKPFVFHPSTNISPLPDRTIVFRVHNLPADADVRWKTEPASNSSSGTIFIEGQKKPSGYYSHEFEQPNNGKSLSLKVGIATGEWATVASGMSSATGSPVGSVVISDALSDGAGNAIAVVSHTFFAKAATRGIAIDKLGKQHIAVPRGGSSAGNQNQTQWKFVGLAPEQVEEFGLQIRPYEWVEFKGLPIIPSRNAATEARTEATPPAIELKIQQAIDVLLQPELIAPVEQWGSAVRTLVEIGSPAVPYLIEVLDAEKRDHPIRKLVFTLRAIGDKRAMPALIRTIPKTHQPPASDYGLEVKDKELEAFLQQHDTENDGNLLTYGRALSEVFRTLQKMSGGESFGEMDLIFVHKRGTAAQQQLQQTLFAEVADNWANWWEKNWQDHVADSRYAKVGLTRQETTIAANPNHSVRFPVGERVRLVKGSDGVMISPNQMRHRDSLFDLDTNRQGMLPRQFTSLGRHDHLSPELAKWCRDKGFDLIGFVELNEADQSQIYGVKMLGLRAWAISADELANLSQAMSGEMPYPLDNEVQEMIPLHSEAGPYEEVAGTPYLFKTREGSYGLIRLHEPGGFPYPSARGSIQYFAEANRSSEVSEKDFSFEASQPKESSTDWSLSVTTPAKDLDEAWTPPENPDPVAIHREASQDTRAGRYEKALAKHLWYHKNALQWQPSQSGVRLSFALSHWLELGEAYPPALQKMKQIRDEAEERIRDESLVRVRFQEFHDYAALNRTLREEERTTELFQWLDTTDPEDAQRVFGVSRKALIQQKLYPLYGKYINPAQRAKRIGASYRQNLKFADESKHGATLREHGNETFVKEATTLVAILAKLERNEEAEQCAAALKQFVIDDSELLDKLETQLQSALAGKL